MSYSEFLNRKKINSPKVIATNMSFGDASSYTWRRKMAVASVYRPTDHVITNVGDPNVVPDLHTKKPTVYKGTGFGRVPDASDYTLSRSATALGRDVFSQTKLVIGGGSGKCLAAPPASQTVGESGNSDGGTRGLNLGYVASCPAGHFTPGSALTVPVFRPQSKSYFVDTLPVIQNDHVGVQSKEAFGGLPNTQAGAQNPVLCSTTKGANQIKQELPHLLHPIGPIKKDFVTGVLGPQVSANGAQGRAPKVGSAIARPKYSEKHHGRAWGPRPFPSAFVPPTGAPAQLKINSPQHYHVA